MLNLYPPVFNISTLGKRHFIIRISGQNNPALLKLSLGVILSKSGNFIVNFFRTLSKNLDIFLVMWQPELHKILQM